METKAGEMVFNAAIGAIGKHNRESSLMRKKKV